MLYSYLKEKKYEFETSYEISTYFPSFQNEIKSVLDIGYEYELANLNVREKARLIAIEDGYHDLAKPEEENGIFRTKASIGVEIPDRYGIFLTGEYGLGSSNQDDYKFGVVLKAVF